MRGMSSNVDHLKESPHNQQAGTEGNQTKEGLPGLDEAHYYVQLCYESISGSKNIVALVVVLCTPYTITCRRCPSLQLSRDMQKAFSLPRRSFRCTLFWLAV